MFYYEFFQDKNKNLLIIQTTPVSANIKLILIQWYLEQILHPAFLFGESLSYFHCPLQYHFKNGFAMLNWFPQSTKFFL